MFTRGLAVDSLLQARQRVRPNRLFRSTRSAVLLERTQLVPEGTPNHTTGIGRDG